MHIEHTLLGGGAYKFVACLSHLTIDRASLSRRRTGGGRTPLLLAVVIWPLTTHPFREGEPFLLLIKTPATFGRPWRFFYMLHRNYSEYLLILSPCCFAFCGHHLSARIVVVFSLLSSVPNFAMSHSSIFLISNKSRSSLYISRSSTIWVLDGGGRGGGQKSLLCDPGSESRLGREQE